MRSQQCPNRLIYSLIRRCDRLVSVHTDLNLGVVVRRRSSVAEDDFRLRMWTESRDRGAGGARRLCRKEEGNTSETGITVGMSYRADFPLFSAFIQLFNGLIGDNVNPIPSSRSYPGDDT
jgi:hypothetical protein